MTTLNSNADDFLDRGPEWAKAYEILCEKCEFPPSLESFEHGLEVARARSRAPISVAQHARMISDTYRRSQ